MDKQELDYRISETAKSILSYCIARTSNQTDAEDLAQDIIVEIYKSSPNLRNADAFYGFMWGIAGNVYKQWCKNKSKQKTCELDENISIDLFESNDSSFELNLLRRELSLLSEKYRKAVILYYIENKSCNQIANALSISESMVKYLLFKSRQLLKEGMNMERIYGQQSYNPKGLTLLFWGESANPYYHLCESKISQNILFACYNDKLTAEQISLEIGVALPYMEDKLNELSHFHLLLKDGNYYSTNIAIFTEDFTKEVESKTMALQEKIADILMQTISQYEAQIKEYVFSNIKISENSFAWQMTCFLLYDAIIERLQEKIKITYPQDQFGTECFVWGVEDCEPNSWKSPFGFGISNVSNNHGDFIQFMDFPFHGDMVHHFFFNKQNATNLFLDVAKNHTEQFSENDRLLLAELIRKGYILKNEKEVTVNAPVFTKEQYQMLKEIIADSSVTIADEAEKLMDIVTKILKNHIPPHLKKTAKDLAFLRLFEDAISAPVALLCERKFLLPYSGNSLLPTTYVVLK